MAVEVRQPALHLSWEDEEVRLNLAPLQGHWTEEQYLLLTDHARHLIEFADGVVEVVPMPTDRHQAILQVLLLAFHAALAPHGAVRFAPLRLRIRARRYREPDLLLVRDARDPRRRNRYWTGADLVVEVVSPDDPDRDYVTKRADYAAAGVGEYWIVDPEAWRVTVLILAGETYVEHGVFGRGQIAAGPTVPQVALAVDTLLTTDPVSDA
jgi:Uma2 family endonuclease